MFSLFRRTEGKEHRTHPRQEVDQFLSLFDEDKFTLLGRICDLSIGGMCVVSDMDIPLGNQAKLIVEINHEDGRTEDLHLRCEAVWSCTDKSSGLCRIGFRFIGVSPTNINKIRQIISRQYAASLRKKRRL